MLRTASLSNAPTYTASEPRKRMATHHFPSNDASTSERAGSPSVTNPSGPPPSIPLPPTPPPSYSPIPQLAAILEREHQKREKIQKETHPTNPSSSTGHSWRTKPLRHARSRSTAATLLGTTDHVEEREGESSGIPPLVVSDRKRPAMTVPRKHNNGSMEDYENAMVMMVDELGLEVPRATALNCDGHVDVHLSSMKNKILKNLLSLSPAESANTPKTQERQFSLPLLDLSLDGAATWKEELHFALDGLASPRQDDPVEDANVDSVPPLVVNPDNCLSSCRSPSPHILEQQDVEIHKVTETVSDTRGRNGLSSRRLPQNLAHRRTATLPTPFGHSSPASISSTTPWDIHMKLNTSIDEEPNARPDSAESTRTDNDCRSSHRSTGSSKRPSISTAQRNRSHVDLEIMSSFERDLSPGTSPSSGPLTSTPAKRIDQFRRIGLGRPPLSRLASPNLQSNENQYQSQPPKPKQENVAVNASIAPTASGQGKENRPRSKKLAVRPPRPQVTVPPVPCPSDGNGEQIRQPDQTRPSHNANTDMLAFR